MKSYNLFISFVIWHEVETNMILPFITTELARGRSMLKESWNTLYVQP